MKRKTNGFTLLELMIAITILAILASIAMFDLGTTYKKNKAQDFSQEFKHLIKFARNKAMTTGDPVVVCALNPSDSNCYTNWKNGKITAFSDIQDNLNYDSDEDVKLRTLTKLTSQESLVHLGGVSRLRFSSQGKLNNGQGGTFVYCPDSTGKHNVEFELTAAGIIREKGATTKTCN